MSERPIVARSRAQRDSQPKGCPEGVSEAKQPGESRWSEGALAEDKPTQKQKELIGR
jgi:hypothetical protein